MLWVTSHSSPQGCKPHFRNRWYKDECLLYSSEGTRSFLQRGISNLVKSIWHMHLRTSCTVADLFVLLTGQIRQREKLQQTIDWTFNKYLITSWWTEINLNLLSFHSDIQSKYNNRRIIYADIWMWHEWVKEFLRRSCNQPSNVRPYLDTS